MAIIPKRETGTSLATSRFDPFELMRDMMRWDPFRELARFGGLGTEAGFTPLVDVKETKDAYVFKADLPGLKEEDLDISFTGNRLTISGKREVEMSEEGDQYFTFERSYGTFTRSFTLPEGIDVEHIEGELKDGVLTVIVPKKPEVQPKRIQLKGGGATVEQEKVKA